MCHSHTFSFSFTSGLRLPVPGLVLLTTSSCINNPPGSISSLRIPHFCCGSLIIFPHFFFWIEILLNCCWFRVGNLKISGWALLLICMVVDSERMHRFQYRFLGLCCGRMGVMIMGIESWFCKISVGIRGFGNS